MVCQSIPIIIIIIFTTIIMIIFSIIIIIVVIIIDQSKRERDAQREPTSFFSGSCLRLTSVWVKIFLQQTLRLGNLHVHHVGKACRYFISEEKSNNFIVSNFTEQQDHLRERKS